MLRADRRACAYRSKGGQVTHIEATFVMVVGASALLGDGNPAAGPVVTYLSPVVLMVVVRRHLAHPEEALMRKRSPHDRR
jgi:hypothetical protein